MLLSFEKEELEKWKMYFGGTVKLNPVGVIVIFGLSIILLLYIFASQKSAEKEVNLKQLLIAVVNVAREGGHSIEKFRNANLNERSKGKTKEGAVDVVTDADYESHCIMYFSLLFTFPSLQIISEEKHPFTKCQSPTKLNSIFSIDPKDAKINEFKDVTVPLKDVTVWIDPLDATKEFTDKLFKYVTTMVCVAVQGKPVIGVIHQPFEKVPTTSWVWVGKGNSQDLFISKLESTDDPPPVVIVSRSHAGNVSDVIEKSMPQAEVIYAGGSGYKVLQLIRGKASAYVHTTAIKKWDICAGNAFLNNFRGRLSTLKNEDIDYSEANAPVVQHGILATISNHKWFYQRLIPLKT